MPEENGLLKSSVNDLVIISTPNFIYNKYQCWKEEWKSNLFHKSEGQNCQS